MFSCSRQRFWSLNLGWQCCYFLSELRILKFLYLRINMLLTFPTHRATPGGNLLDDVTRSSGYPEGQCRRIMQQLMLGVQYCHKIGESSVRHAISKPDSGYVDVGSMHAQIFTQLFCDGRCHEYGSEARQSRPYWCKARKPTIDQDLRLWVMNGENSLVLGQPSKSMLNLAESEPALCTCTKLQAWTA